MGSGFLSYALLIEVIILLTAWIVFIHWRLSKNKKALKVANEVEIPDPFEVYLQYINREISETLGHIDQLSKDPDDIEALTMYQYRHKHLEAEQKAMAEAKGDTVKFWELYRSSIDFVHEVEGEEVTEDEIEPPAEAPSPENARGMKEQLEIYNKNSESIISQSNDAIDLVKTFSEKNGSEEMQHILNLLNGERDELAAQLEKMKNEYRQMMNDTPTESRVSQTPRDEDDAGTAMSGVLTKQNTRISELNNVVGNLSLELEEKKTLVKETEWVTRQLKETEHVVIILEDENTFLRNQIKQLLEKKEE